MKKEIFSKINRNDYNNQLEEILEKKDFSKDVKNLLLSMLYKVELSYEDYATVKRNVKSKSDFIQDILNKIKECNHIIFIKPQSEESKEFEEKNAIFILEDDKNTIKVYPNEKSLLYAINAFDNKRMYLPEKYNYLRIAFPDLINEGKDINNVEIIRDFNAWSWNVSVEEISDININLIYQILQILLGEKSFEHWYLSKNKDDYLVRLKDNLEQDYDGKLADRFLELIYKLSILLCVQKNKIEKKRLFEEKVILEKELEYMEDKETYISDLSTQKKKINSEIKKIDKILNDKDKLKDEFSRRNSKLSEENQIFSLSHLTNILERERRRDLNRIQEINKSIDPKNYIERKQKLKNDFKLIKDIDINSNQDEIISSGMLQLQKEFMRCFEKQIIKSEEKKEIIDLVYIFRYYLFLPYSKEEKVKDIKELKKYFNKIKQSLINRMYELKAVVKITSDETINKEILKYIFETKMIVLENMVIELNKQTNNLQIKIMDTDVLEDTYFLIIKDNEGKKMKYSKKTKVFN